MRLEESLRKKRFVVTSEIQPPIETDVKGLIRSVDRIRGKIDALTVPDLNIEGLVTDTMGTCRILKEQKFEPILQTACREKSRLDIQEHLLKAAESGIDNILTFTEDYRITGDSLQEIMYFHVDSGKLFSVIDIPVGDCKYSCLHRGKPYRKRTGIMLYQYADKSFQSSQYNPVNHYRALLFAFSVNIVQIKPLW